MAKQKVTLDAYTCDGCGKVKHVDPDGEMPYGYHGGVSYISATGGTGGTGGEFFACSDKCIRAAVIRCID